MIAKTFGFLSDIFFDEHVSIAVSCRCRAPLVQKHCQEKGRSTAGIGEAARSGEDFYLMPRAAGVNTGV